MICDHWLFPMCNVWIVQLCNCALYIHTHCVNGALTMMCICLLYTLPQVWIHNFSIICTSKLAAGGFIVPQSTAHVKLDQQKIHPDSRLHYQHIVIKDGPHHGHCQELQILRLVVISHNYHFHKIYDHLCPLHCSMTRHPQSNVSFFTSVLHLLKSLQVRYLAREHCFAGAEKLLVVWRGQGKIISAVYRLTTKSQRKVSADRTGLANYWPKS